MTFFKKLLYLLSPSKKRKLIFLTFLLLIGMFFEMLGLGILIPALTLMLSPNIGEKYPFLIPYLEILGNPSHKELIIGGMIFLILVYLIKSLFLAFLGWQQSKFTSELQSDTNTRLFNIYLNQSYEFHLLRNSAELLRNIQTEVILFIRAIHSLILLSTEIALIIAVTLTLIYLEPLGALIVLIFLSFAVLIFHTITKNYLLDWGKKRQYIAKELNQNLLEGLGGVKDVKILGREDNFISLYTSKNKFWAKINSYQLTLSQIPKLYLEFLGVIGLSTLVITMIIQNKPIELLLPTLVIFVAAAFRMIPGFNRIMGTLQAVKLTVPVVNLLFEEFKLEVKTKINIRKIIDFKKEILIKNLYFKYSNTDSYALKDINLKISKGDTVGFIGQSGSGKSTLIDLVLGLLKPIKGKILIDGFDLEKNIRGWQKNIGYVPQSIFLSDDSLRKNISFGEDEDKIDNKAVSRAVTSAQLQDFIESTDMGLDTFVGERGVRLSGGQRQRIGIARALYHDPTVLVLDEATSALDSQTENDVMDAISALKGKKTIFIVAHRISTLKCCDKIIKIANGKIIEELNPNQIT